MKRTVSITILILILGFSLITQADAAKIIWVAGAVQDSTGAPSDVGFTNVLEAAGYDVQRETDTMTGSSLTAAQMATLESGDLVIISRSTSSGLTSRTTRRVPASIHGERRFSLRCCCWHVAPHRSSITNLL